MNRVVVCLLAVLTVLGASHRAGAEPTGDAVALLPLDAERSLEIYGQPVASEIARALVAGAVQVVVVGPRMAVPERARLIIDGTIASGKAGAVTISLRIRNTIDGVVVENLSATAPGLARIDSAAAELSARVLPIVRDRLAALRRAADGGKIEARQPTVRGPAPARPVRVAISDSRKPTEPGALPAALDAAVASWIQAQHRPLQKVEPGKLAAPGAGELAIGFWILDYQVDDLADAARVQAARARVRVQITSARSIVFDRVVATDSVIGERGLAQPELAARVAREVLAIVRPHLRRSVPSWQ
jgi:hypothetical protein